MGESKTLTCIERGRTLELHEQNLSQRVIESEICCSKTGIAKFLKDPDANRTKNHAGLPKRISLALGDGFGEKLEKNSSQSSS